MEFLGPAVTTERESGQQERKRKQPRHGSGDELASEQNKETRVAEPKLFFSAPAPAPAPTFKKFPLRLPLRLR
jgi:hypothetical protein